ncbi:hypothetical protein BDP27DRAFT_1344261, partial [Rhodocollybia butyracea]
MFILNIKKACFLTLLPIIPQLDDYSCVIRTNIAFKPIRLGCGHLFCVRRSTGDCPMCRAQTVGSKALLVVLLTIGW